MGYSSPGVQNGKVLKVTVHPPKDVTAQEFARGNGTIISTPLPVTTVTESSKTLSRSKRRRRSPRAAAESHVSFAVYERRWQHQCCCCRHRCLQCPLQQRGNSKDVPEEAKRQQNAICLRSRVSK